MILVLVAAVAAMTVWFWDGNPFSAGVLLAVVAVLGFLLLAGWRQAEQRRRDAEEIRMRQESQRRHAAQMPREDRRAIARPLPPAEDEDDVTPQGRGTRPGSTSS